MGYFRPDDVIGIIWVLRLGDRSVKQPVQQRRPHSPGIMSSANDQNSVDSKLTHRLNRPAAESVAMATPKIPSSHAQSAKSSSITVSTSLDILQMLECS